MYFFSLKAFAPVASFRIPEAHIFQQTLPLPPITTLKGLIGAAAGFSFKEAMEFCEKNKLQFGVIGQHRGRAKDLWKYRKVKSGEVISAVLVREFLFDLDLEIFIAAEDKDTVEKIRNDFLNPVYPLCAGPSDCLMKVIDVSSVRDGTVEDANDFAYTVLPGDLTGLYEVDIDLKNVPLLQEIYVPRVFLLPTSFDFSGTERRVRERKHFTFVDVPVTLKKPVKALLLDNNKAVPLL